MLFQAEQAISEQAAAVQNTVAAQNPTVGLVGLAFMALYGAVMIFSGYRLMRFMSKVHAALLLGAFGFGLCQGLGSAYVGIGVGVVLAIVGYKLGDIYYYLNMIVLGLLAGGALGWVAGQLATPQVAPFIAIAGAVLGAVLTVKFERPLGILFTSVLGSTFILIGVLGLKDPAAIRERGLDPGMLTIGLFALGSILGCVVQARTTKNMPEHGNVQNRPAAQKQ